MIRNHPFENIYFNSLAGRSMKDIKEKFDLDYWGLSYTKALEYIAKNDPNPIIKIYIERWHNFMPFETEMLNPQDRKRFVHVENLSEAKYFLSAYRGILRIIIIKICFILSK